MGGLRLTRVQLAEFLKGDQEAIRKFEEVFSVVDKIAPNVTEGVIISAENANTKAQQSLDETKRIEQLLSYVAESPSNYDLHIPFDIIASSLEISTSQQKAQQALDILAKAIHAVELLETMPVSDIYNINGNSATVTVVDAGGDTTTWPMLATSQTGSMSPATDSGLTYDATTNILTVAGEVSSGGLILPKTAGYGIKVDTTTPTFPWRDIIGQVVPKTTGAGTPVFGTFRGNINAWKLIANDIIDFVFHIPHDHVPGTDIYYHVHWGHNGTAISGNVVFTQYATYAKGHNQADFPAEITNTITYNTVDIATTPQYRHRIDEIQMSTAGGSASQLNTTNMEPDGIVMVRMKVTTLPTITGGDLFVFLSDIHYQSTNVGTKSKSPVFWV